MLRLKNASRSLRRGIRIGAIGAALGTLMAGSPVNAWTIFGLELGKPATTAQCKLKTYADGSKSEFVYEDDPAEICIEPDIQLRDAPWRRGSVNFPLKRIPLIVHGSSGFTLVVEGKLEGLQFDTMSYAHQDAIIQELTAKFGRPTSVHRVTATPHGIPIPATEAEWQLPDLYVRYESVGYSVDYGGLWIETPVMQAVRRKFEAHNRAQRPKL